MDKVFDSLQNAVAYCIEQGIDPIECVEAIVGDNSDSCDGFLVKED